MRNGFLTISCIVFFFVTGFTDIQAQTCKPASIPASTPDSQLIDNGNGTVSDSKTGLMWKKCPEGLSGSSCESGNASNFNWQQALEQPGVVNSIGFAGFTDWRLPNIKELISIVEEQCYDPAINLNRFPGTISSGFWSASALSIDASRWAWFVNFDRGTADEINRFYGLLVRLVRGGQ